jgi:tetratricopeptide (TPR) repeat protein
MVIASLSVLAACGSLWVSQQGGSHKPEIANTPDVPMLRPVQQDDKKVIPSVGVSKIVLGDVQRLYREGQQQLYNSALGAEYLQARELLQRARAFVDQLNDQINETEKLYWHARVEFELGNWYHGAAWGDASQAQGAVPYYVTAERLALILTQSAPNFSDGHRLLGETRMRMISLQGWFHALAHAGAAKGSLERALQLDPTNAEAHLALGVYYLYAPQLLGGSPKRALAKLEASEALSSDETTRFLAYRWQGVAYTKLGKIEEAREAFLKALTIYPKSAWDQNELRKLY